MKKNILISLFILITPIAFSQQKVRGMLMDKSLPQGKMGVEGAQVFWLGTSVSAITNAKGWFSIPYEKKYHKLIVSHVGFKTDTLVIKDSTKPIHYFLQPEGELSEIILESNKKTTVKSFVKTQNILTVSSGELLKAACCNLSESFETNPSIDTNFSDALTGVKQIEMLGLKSPYLLVSQENIPSVRGASQVYGMTYTPGTWIESIQITKGAGTVLNGYESISGQINTELVKPTTDAKYFFNAYANLNGLVELNTHHNQRLTDKWSTGLYVHRRSRAVKFDVNKDGFIDAPLSKQINLMSRWQYANPKKGWVSFVSVRFLNDKKQMGQTHFRPSLDRGTTNAWGSEIKTKRMDASAKLGYVFPDLPYQSFGYQVAYSHHNQELYFGLRDYNIEQKSMYSNLIFNSIIGDTRHKFTTGISFTSDNYKELVEINKYKRNENSIGAFFEYTYDNTDNFSAIAGIRVDYHNIIGVFVTPRLHLRYAPWRRGVLRASIGKGTRIASIFAENQQLFASSRKINTPNQESATYGLHPEKAFNYGLSFLQGFTIFERQGDLTIDFYQTNFNNKVIVDWEYPSMISFYNLEGKSIANSIQVEMNYELYKGISIRTAYKYFDVTTDYAIGNLQKPLQAKHIFFGNLSIETDKKSNGNQWRFDITYNLKGKQRLPNTNSSLQRFSKGFGVLNSQITKVFSNSFEFYLGGENITNYKQKNPIVGVSSPFGENFDSTVVYAPIFGANFYIGFRFKIK